MGWGRARSVEKAEGNTLHRQSQQRGGSQPWQIQHLKSPEGAPNVRLWSSLSAGFLGLSQESLLFWEVVGKQQTPLGRPHGMQGWAGRQIHRWTRCTTVSWVQPPFVRASPSAIAPPPASKLL